MNRVIVFCFAMTIVACQTSIDSPMVAPTVPVSAIQTSVVLIPGDLGSREIRGTVRGSNGKSIVGATVRCSHFAYNPRVSCSGTQTTDADGAFTFGLVSLHDTDQVTIRVEASGYPRQEIKRTGYETWTTPTFNFLLAPPTTSSSTVGAWSSGPPLQVSRGEVAAATTGDRIYVIGGFGGSNVTEELARGQNAWVRSASLPVGLNHPAAVGLGDKIYVVGGYQDDGAPTNTLYEFDPAKNQWRVLKPMPTARGALGAAALDGKIYAVGGTLRGDVGNLEMYDPARDAWQALAPMPTPRDHIAVAVARGKIYVIGGRIGSAARNLNVNEEFDPQTNTWRTRAPLPTARSGIAAAALRDMIFVFGGESPQKTFDENEAYDPITDSWKSFARMPTARHGIGAVTFDGRIFVLAGGKTPGGSESTFADIFTLP